MKVLVLGASGMIGSTVLRVLSEKSELEVFGSIRDSAVKRFFNPAVSERLIVAGDAENQDDLVDLLGQIRPDVVINCIGITKHKPASEDALKSIPINALLPHRLAALCKMLSARLIHVSSDCVFSGEKGDYVEDDFADARDLYGQSKAMGEVRYANSITLRTSTIGHELDSQYGLLDWFLAQEGRCNGYTRAIFSGLPTVVFAQIIRDVVIPRRDLSGLYHVAAKPIAKSDLLKLIAEVYQKQIEIVADDKLAIDRSLNPSRFNRATGYSAPDWPQLIELMHSYK